MTDTLSTRGLPAVQWTGSNWPELVEFVGADNMRLVRGEIFTRWSKNGSAIGDWIVRFNGSEFRTVRAAEMKPAWMPVGAPDPEVAAIIEDLLAAAAVDPDPGYIKPSYGQLCAEVERLQDLIRSLVEPIYGITSWSDDMIVRSTIAEIAMLRDAHNDACKTIAEMHAAAVGRQTGPIRGVVEDVLSMRSVADAVDARCDRMESLGDDLVALVRSIVTTTPDAVTAWESFMRRSSEQGRCVPEPDPIAGAARWGEPAPSLRLT